MSLTRFTVQQYTSLLGLRTPKYFFYFPGISKTLYPQTMALRHCDEFCNICTRNSPVNCCSTIDGRARPRLRLERNYVCYVQHVTWTCAVRSMCLAIWNSYFVQVDKRPSESQHFIIIVSFLTDYWRYSQTTSRMRFKNNLKLSVEVEKNQLQNNIAIDCRLYILKPTITFASCLFFTYRVRMLRPVHECKRTTKRMNNNNNVHNSNRKNHIRIECKNWYNNKILPEIEYIYNTIHKIKHKLQRPIFISTKRKPVFKE